MNKKIVIIFLSLLLAFSSSYYVLNSVKAYSGDDGVDSVYNLSQENNQYFPNYGAPVEGHQMTAWDYESETAYVFGNKDSTTAVYEWKIGSQPSVVANLDTGVFWGEPIYNNLDNKIYIYGGGSNDIQWFKPSDSSEGTLGATMPLSIEKMTGQFSPTQNTTYLFGGQSVSTKYNRTWKHVMGGSCTRMMQNNLTDTIATVASAYVPSQDSIYLFGGKKSGSYHHGVFDDIYRFWCANETLHMLSAKVPEKQTNGIEGAAAYYNTNDDLIYVFGGYGVDSSDTAYYTDNIFTFNPVNYSVVNCTANLLAAQDDWDGFYNEGNSLGYLLPAMPSGGLVNNNQRFIHQVNFTAGSSGGSSPEFIYIDGGGNGTAVLSSMPTFNWTVVSGAIQYHLQIATSSNFSVPYLVVNLSDINEANYPTEYVATATKVSFMLPAGSSLSSYGEYFCRVRARSL